MATQPRLAKGGVFLSENNEKISTAALILNGLV